MQVLRFAVVLLFAPLCAQSPQANSHIAVRGTFNPHNGQTYTALTGFRRGTTEYALFTTQRITSLVRVDNPDGPFPIHNPIGYPGPDDWKSVVVIDTNVGEYAAALAGSPGDNLSGFIRFTPIVGNTLGQHTDWAGGATSVTTPHSIAVSSDMTKLGVCDPAGGRTILYQINPGALPQSSPHNPALIRSYPHTATHNAIHGNRLTSVVSVLNQPHEIQVHDGAALVSSPQFLGAGIPHGVATTLSGTHALVASITPAAPTSTYKLTSVEAISGAMTALPNTWEIGPTGSTHGSSVHIRGDIAYVAYRTVGFRAYDISALPAVPPAIMSYDNPIVGGTPDELVDVYPQPSGVIYALYERSGFRILQPAFDVTPYGVGTAGTGGATPLLAATTPYLGGILTFGVSNGLPNTLGVLLLGTTSIAVPYLGITLLVHPSGLLLTPGFVVNGSGVAALPLPIPNNLNLLSAVIFNQGVLIDAGGPAGFSATRGVRLN